ncbi:hypothetical protein CASFOL_001491 [Castilleja foliolosa]|uniref:Uncharacterized protein n=1 Tax=Castilleja foliolosa TaxID=1961234 RepID=A0ABD3EML3_9LAMI
MAGSWPVSGNSANFLLRSSSFETDDSIGFRFMVESLEGRRMMDFKKSLPTFREKKRLLQAIARNQLLKIAEHDIMVMQIIISVAKSSLFLDGYRSMSM